MKNEIKENDEVKSIVYSYSGTCIGDIYTYKIYRENQEVKLKVEYMNINSDNPDIVTINNDILDNFLKLMKKFNASEWNGYNKTNSDVLDGSSFSMEIKLNNDRIIAFSGCNCAPKGYYEFSQEWLALIEENLKFIKNKYNLD